MKNIRIIACIGFILCACNRSPEHYFKKGNDFHLSGKYIEAIGSYNRALRIKRNYPEALNSRGLTYEKLKDRQKAENDFKKAIEFAPEYMPSYANLSGMYMDLGAYKKALYYLDAAIRKKSDYAYAYLNKGIAKYKTDDAAGAYKNLSKAIELDNKFETAFYYRALALNNLGDPIAALDDLNFLINLNAKISIAYFERGKIKFNLKDYEAAMKDFRAASNLMPRNAVYHYWAGLSIYKKKFYSGALAEVELALKLVPQLAIAKLLKGDICFSIKDYECAHNSYAATKKLDPANSDVYDKRLKKLSRAKRRR